MPKTPNKITVPFDEALFETAMQGGHFERFIDESNKQLERDFQNLAQDLRYGSSQLLRNMEDVMPIGDFDGVDVPSLQQRLFDLATMQRQQLMNQGRAFSQVPEQVVCKIRVDDLEHLCYLLSIDEDYAGKKELLKALNTLYGYATGIKAGKFQCAIEIGK